MDVVIKDECRVSLIKVPQFVAQSWRKRPPGEIVALLEEDDQTNSSSQATTVPSPGQQSLKRNFTLLLSASNQLSRLTGKSTPVERMHLISQINPEFPKGAIASPFNGTIGEDANDEGLTVEATISETVVMTPLLTDGSYKNLLKARAAAAIRPGREVIEEGFSEDAGSNISNNNAPRLFQYYNGGNASEDSTAGKQRKPLNGAAGTTSVQAKKDQIRMALFDIFESRTGGEPLTMTELTRLTRQTQQFLKPLLDECAMAVPAGGDRRRVTYVLRPEFARR